MGDEMKNVFTIYDENGNLDRVLRCNDGDLILNVRSVEIALAGEYPNSYLQDGIVKQKPTQPSQYHEWDVVNKVWVANLENAKTDMWRKIQAERTRRMDGGYPVVFDGKTWWMHSDTTSLGQQQGLVQMAQLTAMQGKDMGAEITKWKTMTGEFVSMTGNFALAMFAAGMAQQGAIFQQAEIHKAKMSALAEPWAYDFSNGWAKIYEEV